MLSRTNRSFIWCFALCACGEAPSDVALDGSELTGGVQVGLLFAKGLSRCADDACSSALGRITGYIEVANLAYHKEVVVHYEARQQPGWRDARAVYVSPTWNGFEAWRFETEEVPYTPRLSADFSLAIRYTVGGRTYWDNNHGADHHVSTGPRPLYPERILGESVLALIDASAFPTPSGGTSFSGRVLLKDIAYQKHVRVVYSVDGWASAGEVEASYQQPAAGGTEYWHFIAEVPSASQIEFAISYQVAGRTYWDNNFRSDYSIAVPGTIE